MPKTGGLKLSAVYSARSGIAVLARDTTFDADRNGITDKRIPAGRHLHAALSATMRLHGRLRGRPQRRRAGPNYQRLDLRAGYRIRLGGGRTIDAFLDLFNATNEPNFANPMTNDPAYRGRRVPATFLRITQTINESPTRTAQLNFRFGF